MWNSGRSCRERFAYAVQFGSELFDSLSHLGITELFIGGAERCLTELVLGLADRCEIQVSYAIGQARPFSVDLDLFGTAHVDPDRLTDLVEGFFDFRPAAIIDRLKLQQPIYEPTSAYGHFGRDEFPWESADDADQLARAAADL